MYLQLIITIIFICVQEKISVAAQLKTGSQCDVVVKKVGCFKDDSLQPRPLPELLLTDRDPFSPRFSGKLVDWKNWSQHINNTVCRCARETKNRKYTYFGIQFYGECWSGPKANQTYNRAGMTDKCVSSKFKGCDTASSLRCVGMDETNFVYEIQEQKAIPAPVEFKKLSCFCNKLTSQAGFHMIFTDVDTRHPLYSGIYLNWAAWEKYLSDLASRCAKKAKLKGAIYFVLQNYGECWSAPNDVASLSMPRNSNCCKGKDLNRSCEPADSVCVGTHQSAYVYQMK